MPPTPSPSPLSPTHVCPRAKLAAALCAIAISVASCDKVPPAHVSPAPAVPHIQRTQRTSAGEAILDLTTTIDRTDLSVADRLNITFACTTRADATLTFPEISAALGDFTVASSARSERLDPRGNRITTLSLILEPFLAGNKVLPPLAFEAIDTGKTLALKTDPITVHVVPIADANADAKTPLEPAKAPVGIALPARSHRTVLIATIAGVTVAIAAALSFAALASSRRQKREANPAFRARRELDAIRRTLGQSSTRAHASDAIARIFRAFAAYLSDGLGIPANTQPHATIAAAISLSPRFTADQRNELNALLAELERVRFAPDAASVPAAQTLLDRVSSFVDQASTREALA